MSDPILYKGRGTPDMYDDLMDFMNYVFGFDGNGEIGRASCRERV